MPETVSVPLTAAIADFVAGSGAVSLPELALDLAERAVVDTIGVAAAAASDSTVMSMRRACGTSWPVGGCTLFPQQGRVQPVQAALLNGTAAHALDFDDVADELIGHPSAVLVPAALAMAEDTEASGTDLLTAYCIGFQVESALAAGMSMTKHYARGWHSTATLGVFGAAAAAGYLLRLKPSQVRHALGIAASLAAGSRQNFGSMTKSLHAGAAASNGVFAASLAAADFTADPAQLEAPLGYFRMYGEEISLPAALTVLEGEWALARGGLNVKKHPCCYKAARAADAMLQLVTRGLQAEEVSAVSVTVEPEGLGPLIHHRPTTGLQAKFSLEYILAACLTDGGLSLRSFTDTAVDRDLPQRLLPLITGVESTEPTSAPSQWRDAFAEVRVDTRGGETLSRRVEAPRGHASAPLSDDELHTKFADCVHLGDPMVDHDALFANLRGLRHRSTVTGLLTRSQPRPAPDVGNEGSHGIYA